MSYSFYVTDHVGNRVPVHIHSATEADFQRTVDDSWQTSWTTQFIQQRQLEKYAMVAIETKELIGLCACRLLPKDNCLRMVYMESEPGSNPTLVKTNPRKYYDIGKAIIAYAVERAIRAGMDGTLSFKAKTTQLYKHYIEDFGARPLPYGDYELILFPEAGFSVLQNYLHKEDNYE